MASDTLSYLYSPGYPDSYESNVTCNWGIFSKDRNMRIQVTVQLENDLENCSSTGVLKLRDTFSSQEIVLCNYAHPTNITVHALVSFPMGITLHSGPDELGPAFRISYQQVAAPTTSYPVLTRPCNDTYLTATGTEQYISSPGYPYPYLPNLECVWYITAPRGKMIHVQVVASEVEYSTGCPFDKVEAYDGATVQSSLLETWCGDRAPTFQSTGNAMLLRFTTDPSLAESGFRLKYSMTEIPYVCATNVTVTRSQTMIYSPMYPVRYPRNLNCLWDLTTEYGSNIKLMVMESNLQSYCTRDYIALYDDSGEVGSFCENNYQNYISSGSKMRIRFYSGSFGSSGTGFKLAATGGYYKVCGKSTLSAESSSNDFTSPRYPFHYPNNADCIWVISTYYSNYFITLEVVNSDIENSAGCLKDYLEAFDGRNTFEQSLGRWCGMFTPTKKSSSGSMTVLFHTDESYTKSGFQISYYSNLKNKEDEETGNVNDAALWGGLAGGGFLLAIVILCGRSYKKRKLSQRAQRDVRRRPAHVMGSVGQLSVPTPNYTVAYSQQQVSIQPENTGEFYNAAMFDLPPSYDEVIKNNIEFQVSTCDNSVPDSGTTNSTTTESPAEDTRL
ncbi:deleted in malignant brain tumors 1 protein-like [Haliotis rufescens]|uniref:deleted in malignant brain tumors 1 protein-like n=1 Tax=Haliotis rufescens TaxID=6454 RepID=UPI00201EEF3E|nr:deleted in malignant brain tumors 1 protein-like [Haliotis rufescens]